MEIIDGAFRRKKVSFSMVPNELIQDKHISLRAKGLYALIQSYITREDFTLYKDFLLANCQEGKKAFENAWKELKTAGYLKPYRMQGERGRFYYEYELLDVPERPELEKPERPEPKSPGKAPEKAHNVKTPDKKRSIPEAKEADPESERPKEPPVTLADLQSQIGYSAFLEEGKDVEMVDSILMLMKEVFDLEPGQKIRVNQNSLDCSKVKERFQKIDFFGIQYVLHTLGEVTDRVKNTRQYMLTTLFNAPVTHGYYFSNWVNSDMNS